MISPEDIRGIYKGWFKLCEEIGDPNHTENTATLLYSLVRNPILFDELTNPASIKKDLTTRCSHATNTRRIIEINEEYRSIFEQLKRKQEEEKSRRRKNDRK